MAFKKIYDHRETNPRRIFSQTDFSGGIRYGVKNVRMGETLQSVDNFLLENGSLVSRPGQRRAHKVLHGVCKACTVFNGRLFMQLGVSLYSWDVTNEESPTFIDNLNVPECVMFSFAGKLYIMSPDCYYCYDTELKSVEPYVPVVAVDRSCDGSTTTVYESFNMIGSGFEVWFNFSGDGEYKLPLESLNGEFSATLSGNDISEKCSFNAEEGIITVTGFSEEDEGINNLRVRAYRKDKDVKDGRNRILGCKYSAIFGGTDGLGTRIFLSGNQNEPNVCFRSGLLDPSYFPDTEYEIIGHEGDKITGLMKQYNELIVFCENSIHALSYVYSEGDVIFSRRTINSSVGCDMPHTIQLIDNNAVFCSSEKGVFMLSSTISENENNVLSISANVNKGKDGLIAAARSASKKGFSLDFDGKYYLFLGDKAFVWDYGEVPYLTSYGTVKAERKLCWYVLSGFQVNFPAVFDGNIVFFSDIGQIDVYGDGDTDFGKVLKRSLTTSPSGLGLPRIEKKLKNITLSYRCKGNVDIDLYFYCDGKAENEYFFNARISHSDMQEKIFHRTVIPVSLPPAYSFNIKTDVSGGSFELDCIDYEYTV